MRMVGAHQAIPQVEIETKISARLLVMKSVVGDGVQDSSPAAVHESMRKNLVAAMPRHIEAHLPKHEEAKRKWVHWEAEDNQRRDSRLYERFPGTE